MRSVAIHGVGVIDAVLDVSSSSAAFVQVEAEGDTSLEVLGNGRVVSRFGR